MSVSVCVSVCMCVCVCVCLSAALVDPFSRFERARAPTCDRQTDRQTDIPCGTTAANTALAQRYSVAPGWRDLTSALNLRPRPQAQARLESWRGPHVGWIPIPLLHPFAVTAAPMFHPFFPSSLNSAMRSMWKHCKLPTVHSENWEPVAKVRRSPK